MTPHPGAGGDGSGTHDEHVGPHPEHLVDLRHGRVDVADGDARDGIDYLLSGAEKWLARA